MYTKTARFYDAIYHFLDYEGGARKLHDLIQERAPHAKTLLDVACGTGQHVQHLNQWYDVEGLDLDGQLLAVARERCPDVPLHEGDMVDFRLPRKFDVITCLFSAVAVVETLPLMQQATANMARHLRPGGLLIIEPWFEPDSYWADTVTANHYEQPDLKICWVYTSKREGDVSVLDVHYLVGTSDGVEHLVEVHRSGLFTRSEHQQAMADAGLVDLFYDETGLLKRGLHIGTKSTD